MTHDKDSGCSVALALIAAAIPVLIYQVWSARFVAERLWRWFVVEELHVRPVGWRVWSALFFIYGLMRNRVRSRGKDEREKSEVAAELFMWLLSPWVVLAIGAALR